MTIKDDQSGKNYPIPAVVEVTLKRVTVDFVARSDEQVENIKALAALLRARVEVLPYE